MRNLSDTEGYPGVAVYATATGVTSEDGQHELYTLTDDPFPNSDYQKLWYSRPIPQQYTNMYGNFSGDQYELLNGRQARVSYDRGRKVSAYYSNSSFWTPEDSKAFSDAAIATGPFSYANFHYPPDKADYMQSPTALADWMHIHHRGDFPTPEYRAIYQMLKDLGDSAAWSTTNPEEISTKPVAANDADMPRWQLAKAALPKETP